MGGRARGRGGVVRAQSGFGPTKASGGTADLVFEQDATIEDVEGYRIEVDASYSVKVHAAHRPDGSVAGRPCAK